MEIKDIKEHVNRLEAALSYNEFLDIGAARKIAGVLDNLFSNYEDFPSEHRSLIVGAARYFIQDLDVDPDSTSVLGLDDDVQVLNYVLDQIGRSDLRVAL